MRIRRGAFVFVVLCLVAFAAKANAQLAPSPDAPPVSTAPAPSQEERAVATLKLNVNLVDLFFTVKDKSDELVPHLTRTTAPCSKTGAQTLKSFVAETNQPLTLGIMLDTSGSQQNVLPLEQQAGSQFLQRVLRSKTKHLSVSFDVNVDLLQDYTNSRAPAGACLNKAEINTAGGNGEPVFPAPVENYPHHR